MKRIIILVVAIMLVTVGIVGAFYYDRVSGINSPEGRFKMNITGNVNYGFAGIGGWSITDTKYSIEQMSSADLSFLSLFWWWESGHMKLRAELIRGSVVYRKDLDLGKMNVWIGSSESYYFYIDMIKPSDSPYTLKLTLYESNVAVATVTFAGIYVNPAN